MYVHVCVSVCIHEYMLVYLICKYNTVTGEQQSHNITIAHTHTYIGSADSCHQIIVRLHKQPYMLDTHVYTNYTN